MKIAIYGKRFDASYLNYIQQFFNIVNEKDAEIIVYEPFFNYIVHEYDYVPKVSIFFSSHNDLKDGVDFFFSIGGDGTFLDSVGFVRDLGIPIVGLNTGRLGFLADICRDNIPNAINNIFEGNYSLEKRTLLQLSTENNLFGELNFALNDLTVNKRDSSSMITIHAYLGDRLLNSYWADGLIIATPTGSTAYSLSAGGPIVVPGSDNFIITPLASHNLTVRPLVISNTNKISLQIDGRDSNFMLSLDSRFKICHNSIKLHISKASFSVNLLKPNGTDYFNTLRNKLMWGLDRRN